MNIEQNPYRLSTIDKKSKINDIYTILVVLYPLLSMYRFGNTIYSISEFCAGVVLVLIILQGTKNFKLNKLFLCIAIFFFINICIVALINNKDLNFDKIDLIGSSLRLLLVYFLLSLANRRFVFELGKKVVIYVAIISTIYLLIQYIASLKGIYIGGGIPFFSQYAFRGDVSGYVNDVIKYGVTYRARSFFEEPAHFCQYVIVAILLLLFDENKNKKVIKLILLDMGIVFSMSLLGWLMLIFVYAMWGIFYIKNKIVSKKVISCVLFLPIICLGLWNTDAVQNVIEKKFLNQVVSADTRFEGMSILSELSKEGFVYFIFGNGLVDSETYYAGITRLLYSFGVIGLVFALLIFIYYLNKYRKDKLSKTILLSLAVLSFGSEIIFGKYILVYLAFIGVKDKRKVSGL